MTRLFWKIFLSYWLASIAIVVATAWSTAHLYRSSYGGGSPFEARLQADLNQQAAAAVKILENRGPRALHHAFGDFKRGRRGPRGLFLLNEQGQDVLERRLPEHFERLRNAIAAGEVPTSFSDHGVRVLVSRTFASDAKPYFLVATMRPPRDRGLAAWWWRRPEFVGVRLGLAILLSGIVCFWLARHLTHPLGRLSAATEKIASGHFDTRVAEEIGPRRDEFATLAHDFDRMAGRLQALMGSQQQLLRDVSHELRSPLARLQVALGLARQRSDGNIEPELDRIERECEEINEMIGELVSIARMETSFNNEPASALDLTELVQGVAADAEFEATALDKQVVLGRVDQVSIDGHRELLHRAIENVVRNAVRYTDKGTAVVIDIAEEPTALTADNSGESSNKTGVVTVRVRDHGPGVPEADLARLFEPFVRVGEARDRDSGGYGLGLAIADRAIKVHQGRISAHNAEDGGLIVEIQL